MVTAGSLLGGHWGLLRQESKGNPQCRGLDKLAHGLISPGWRLLALVCFSLRFSYWHSSDPVKFVCYLIAALLASSFKVSLPGIEGTLSMNFLFTLVGILEMSLPETLLIGLVSTLAQFYWKPARRLKLVQLVFNLSHVTVCSAAAYGAYKLVAIHVLHGPGPLALLAAAITHFSLVQRRCQPSSG